MSGIAGIVNFDGAPVDRALLSRMTASLGFRGPDARRIWIDGNVGFGHTLLRTTYEAEHEQQPFSFDRDTWIVADCRVDAREELVSKLQAKGRDASLHRPDVELILHAWHVWGENCVEHLLGDFAFAIWDAPHRRLFCARDHMGVKLFYYARIGSTLIFSNTLDCVRLHPAVSDKLNDLAIADFLLFDMNQEPDTTFFSEVRCLPPAHVFRADATGGAPRRYWSIPIEEPVRFQKSSDYVDRFRELLNAAVRDRARTPRVAVYMSGGLDSTSVAAAARPFCDVKAFTVVYDRLIPDEERYYSGIAARALNIPIEYLAADDYQLFERWDEPEQRRPEPCNYPLRAIQVEQLKQISTYSRVAFNYEGSDNCLRFEWRPYIKDLARRRRFGRLLADVARYTVSQRKLPFIPGLPGRFKRVIKPKNDTPSYPAWLNPEFEARFGLRERWEAWQRGPAPEHPLRPKGYASLKIANWRAMFDGSDSGFHRFPVEVRYPFVDIRLVRYMLSLPAIPWCANKHIEREAARGALPEHIRRRPKAPLAGDPVSEQIRNRPKWWRERPALDEDVLEYLEEPRRATDPSGDAVWENWIKLRPFSLSNWFQRLQQRECESEQEEYDEVGAN